MSGTRNLFTEIRASSRQQLIESLKWITAVVMGGLLPLWGGYLMLLLFSQPVTLSDFASNGEFALYSAAFLTPALYLVGRDVRDPFVHRQLFMLGGILMLIISVLLFAAVTAAATAALGAAQIGGIQLDRNMLINWSLVLLAITSVFAFLVNLLDSILIGFDPAAESGRDRDLLRDAFRATGNDDVE